MKKIVFFLFATMLVASVKAQVYVGGTVGLWHNDDLDATFFKLEPEVGYNLSEKWAVGGVLAFAHGKADEGKYNAFALAPYARYSYYENKVVRLFVDGGFGFSTQKVKGFDSVNGFEIGFKPGIAIKLNSKFSAVAKCGFLGYRRLHDWRQRLRIRLHQRRPLIRFPLRVLIPDKAYITRERPPHKPAAAPLRIRLLPYIMGHLPGYLHGYFHQSAYHTLTLPRGLINHFPDPFFLGLWQSKRFLPIRFPCPANVRHAFSFI